MTGVTVSCGIQMFDVGVRRCGCRAAGSAINGTRQCEVGLWKAGGHGAALSALLPPSLSAVVQCGLAGLHLTSASLNHTVFLSAAGGSHNEAKYSFSSSCKVLFSCRAKHAESPAIALLFSLPPL